MGAGVRDAFPPPDVCVDCIHPFAYGNAAVRTFGWARRHRPYVFCLRELRVDVRPYIFRLDRLRVERLMSFGWIVRKWLFCLYGIAWKNMMEMGRGGAYVPARVAPQGRIHR